MTPQFVGGDKNLVNLGLQIMPLRSRQSQLAGVDVVYLLEKAIERRTWYWEKRIFDLNGGVERIDNPNKYPYDEYNRYPFTRKLQLTGSGTLGDAWNLQTLLFNGEYYMANAPHETHGLLNESINWADEEPVMTWDMRTQSTLGDTILRKQRVLNMFADLKKARYVSNITPYGQIPVMHNTVEVREVAEGYYPTYTLGYAARYDSELDKCQVYFTIPKKNCFSFTSVVGVKNTGLKVYMDFGFHGRHSEGGTATDVYYEFIKDVTSIASISMSGATINVQSPELGKSFIQNISNTLGFQLWTCDQCKQKEEQYGHIASCVCWFQLRNVYVIGELNGLGY